jgi:hypothetical protein
VIRKLALAAVGVLSLCCSTLRGQTAIERIAPENSVLIVGSKSMQTFMDRFKKTGLWSLWQSDEMQKMRADSMKEMEKGLNDALQELGVEKDSLVPPTGPVGFAVFPVMNEEIGKPQISFLAMADYGDNAEKTDKLVVAAITKAEKDGDIEFEQKDVNGKTIYTIDMSKLQAKEAKNLDDMDMGGGMPIPMPNAEELTKSFQKMHYVRDGNSLMLSPDLGTLSEAMDSAAGKGKGKGPVSERADFQTAVGKIGDADIYVVLLTRDVMDIISAADEMGMAQMIKPMVRAVFGEVQSYGMGLRMDAGPAMLEETFSIVMPSGKAGLTTLIDEPTPRGKLPAFVGADTVSYTRFNFEFANLMDVIKKIVTSNPMLNAQAGEMIPQIEEQMGPILAAMGSQMHVATSVSKPYTANSQRTMTAIECTKPQDFENAFGKFAGQMGLEPRDFLGQRIYTMSAEMMGAMMPMPGMDGGMEPMSIGIGGGYIMMGSTPAVEQGLRATGQNDAAAGLGAGKDFQRAMNTLSNEGVIGWGYSDTITSMEAGEAVASLQMRKQIEDAKASAEPGAAEEAAAMEASMNEGMAMWKAINFELLRDYIGPMSWQINSTPDGFTGRFFLLPSEKAASR